MRANALDRHLALIGFMGAGKSTIGPEVARRIGREFFDVDAEIERAEGPIADIFDERGELSFRELEAAFVAKACNRRQPAVIALGGGAVESPQLLHDLDVFVVYLAVDLETAWARVRGSRRPLARDEQEFRRRYELRRALYEEVADARADDVDDVVLAAAGIRVGIEILELLGAHVPGEGPLALVTDPHVAGIHGAAAQLALGDRLLSTHEVPSGESAKTAAVVERLWRELRLDRSGTLVALGGGCVTDVAGLAAATHLRGIPWVTVPTTLVGQVDAGIGGKTAIDIPQGKNLVGAFHWPARVVIDEAVLETLGSASGGRGSPSS